MTHTTSSPPSEYSVLNLTRGQTLATRVQLASDSQQRRRGLLGITELDAGAGIWINPCEAVHTFGMKIILDAVFLDGDLRVRKIAAHLRPRRIAVCLAATSVLELRAGTVAATFTEPGDQLSFTAQKSSRSADKEA